MIAVDPDRLERVKTMKRSVSQVLAYEKCPHAYYLARVAKVWQRPAAWLSMGLGIHSAAEEWESSGRTLSLDEVKAVYSRVYAESINKSCEETPNFEAWFNSGPYDGEADTNRRYLVGLEHVERLFNFYSVGRGKDDVVWIAPDGTPGLEFGFEVDLDGVGLRGYIDRINDKTNGVVEPVDYKSGIKAGDMLQLDTYGTVLEQEFDVKAPTGVFFMTKTGAKPRPRPLNGRQYVVDRFHAMDEAVRAERFEPNPGEQCGRCDMRASCEFAAA